MQIVEINASRWSTVEQVYGAIYDALGSPYTACNINALMEGLYWDHAYDDFNGTSHCADYKVKPPFRSTIVGTESAPKEIVDELKVIEECLADAHRWFRKERGGRDVEVEFEIAIAKRMTAFQSPRLAFTRITMADARDVFAGITPAITRYLTWDPPTWEEYRALTEASIRANNPNQFNFVVRRRDTNECLGMAALEDATQPAPEIGLWLKETTHGQGYGREVVEALIAWAAQTFGKESFTYPVATQNTASRRIAERLGGTITRTATRPKYAAVIYRIPAKS
ncbi:MAG TPA: GNAT family N-acetyltransferase [Rhizomicrobium sp.]|jgi:RimJ/RimL family protein N-acetyltransferase|nr:GNAT family N-acetyltransferase [Rhizomicrobium sp.]